MDAALSKSGLGLHKALRAFLPHRLFTSSLLVVIVLAAQNVFPGQVFTASAASTGITFDTGTAYGEMCDPYNSRYPQWDQIRDEVRIYRLMVFAKLEDDGTLTPWGQYGYPDCGVTYDQLVSYCREIIGKQAFPLVSLWIGNFETMTENGLKAFLQKWASDLGSATAIFIPAWEFNQPPDWEHWGTRVGGGDGSWYIEASVYNSKMTMIRSVRDSLRITNILIGAHANLWMADAYNERGDSLYLPWIDGMRQANVVGVSGYDDNVDELWSHAQHVYELIGQTKPFFFFEYANRCFWNGESISAFFVNRSYAKVPSYPFVKGFVWWTGSYITADAISAIGYNAAIYAATDSTSTLTVSARMLTTTSSTTTSRISTSVFTYAWSTHTVATTSSSTSHQTITSTLSSGTVPSTYTIRETLYSIVTSLLTKTSTSTGTYTSTATQLSKTGTETLNRTLTSQATSSNTVYVHITVENTFIEQFLSRIVSTVVDWLTELTQIIHSVFVTETVRDTIVRVEPTTYSSTTTLATSSTTPVSSTSTTTTSATTSTTVMSSTSSLSTSRSTTTTVATSSLTSYQATTSTQGTGAKGAPRFVLDVSPKPGYAGKPVTISGVMYGSWRCIRDGVVVSKSVEIATGWGFKTTIAVSPDGRFSVVATGPSTGGSYAVSAIFYEDQDLAGASAAVTYQVAQFVETVLSLGHRSVADNSGNGRLFSGYLKEKNGGKPVAGKTIKLTIVSGGNAMTFTLETNSQGYYEYKFNGNGGIFTSATASFAGDNTFLPSTAKVGYSNSSPSGSTLPNGENYVYSTNQTKSDIVGFTNIQSCLDSYNPNVYVISGVNHGNICLAAAPTAEKGTVRFVLDVSPKPGYAGKSVTISGVMYGSWRCIRDGVVVTKPVEITTGWGFKATVTVGADGRFSVVATGPSTGGSYAVTVTFYEDQDLAGSSATVTYQVVQYVETVLSLGHRSVADNSGNGRLFSGYLKEKNGGKPVASKTIKLTIISGGNAMTFTLKTNSQGYYEYKFNGNGGIFSSATASFAGDSTFLPSTAKVAG